ALIGIFLSENLWVHKSASRAYENITMLINPSTEQAFALGELHFDSGHPNDYDITRAQYFFSFVRDHDPNYPYFYHQLARIAFLRSDFVVALSDINLQIILHGDSEPNSYYVRGLIEGYMGDYTDSATDYRRFIAVSPSNWAATNDLAWVLLKDNK